MPTTPNALPSFRRQQLRIEFASLQQSSPPGIYLTLSPTQPDTLWHGLLFPRRGAYAGAVLRFIVTFPETYPVAEPVVCFPAAVMHPLVEVGTGRMRVMHRRAAGGEVVVAEWLGFVRDAFEREEEVLRRERVVVVDPEARISGWEERVKRCVEQSLRGVEGGGEEEVVRVFAGLEKGVVDGLVKEAGARLKERGVKSRE